MSKLQDLFAEGAYSFPLLVLRFGTKPAAKVAVGVSHALMNVTFRNPVTPSLLQVKSKELTSMCGARRGYVGSECADLAASLGTVCPTSNSMTGTDGLEFSSPQRV